MFNAFSWGEFFTVAIGGAIAYYIIAGVALFHREIRNRLAKDQTVKERKQPITVGNTVGLIQRIDPVEIQMADRRTSLSSPEEIMFADSEEMDDLIQAVETKPINLTVGTVPDLLEEIKTVISQIATLDMDTEELTALFESLLARYAQLRGTPFQETISVFIHELSKDMLDAEIPLEQVRTWWNYTL